MDELIINHINITDKNCAEEVLSLQQAAYIVEAQIIGTKNIPPLRENANDLLTSGETFIGCLIENQLAGAVSYKIVERKLDIHRVMVHPQHFRKGIAQKLLAFLESLDQSSTEEFIVSTCKLNLPAVQLYEKLGFKLIGETVLSDGLELVHFEKRLKVEFL